ncbi:MAG: prenyltransferase/squalene oxidase repeat-containing protein [Patescibacteria group bacterium]|mgnify:CR=1 FL=1|jgi:hypothetical protein|nr:prenyltransferase/squalene oxidase repeat-containing protein [Patescibacteria group bacterium]MDP6769988.1 prenyltransferase/squalene oxidase repeat-containing protein [Anaerolineales bacterium]
MLNRVTLYIVISSLIILPIIALTNLSKVAVASEVATYLASIEPATDWIIMAQSAIGATTSDTSFLQELDGTGSVNDYATYILAITSLGQDPRSFGNENLVYGLRQLVTNRQIGDETLMNDDIFGLLALRAAGVPTSDPLVTQTVNYIKNNQLEDGGWNWSINSESSSTDYTAMGIMALISAGVSASNSSIIDASDYLSNIQKDDGGFPMASGQISNTASTAWALSALYAMEADISFWKPSTQSPIDYLNARQHADGYFLFDETSTEADLFTPITTSYASIALSEKYYPITIISTPPQVHVRIEGQTSTICDIETEGRTALDVIKATAGACDYTYVIEDTQYGPYLTTIAGEAAAELLGWSYLPNYNPAQVGAADHDMVEGDYLLWFYGAWNDLPLRIVHDETQVELNSTITAVVQVYFESAWQPIESATLARGAETFTTDANGQVSLSWSENGAYYLTATADAGVRSEQVLVVVGDAGEQVSLPLSVTIGGNDGRGGGGQDPAPSSVTFGVSGDLSFGTLNPGQSSTKSATLSNNSTSSISESRFQVQGIANAVATERVRVTNTDIMEQRYELSTSNEYDISMSHLEFKLSPGKSKDVVLRFRQPQESSQTQLSLLSFDANQTGPLKVGNGIKLPIEFITAKIAGASISDTSLLSAPTFSSWNIVIYVIDAILIVIASWLVTRRKFAYKRAGNYQISFI